MVVVRPVHHQLPEAARQDGAGEVPHRDPGQQQEALLLTTRWRFRARVAKKSRTHRVLFDHRPATHRRSEWAATGSDRYYQKE